MDAVEQGLLERLRVDRDDLQTWNVYGDLLLQRGESRGRLINLEIEFEEMKRANQTLSVEYEQAKRENARLHRPPCSSEYIRKVCAGLRPRYMELIAGKKKEDALSKTLRVAKSVHESKIFGRVLCGSACLIRMGHLKYLILRSEAPQELPGLLRAFASPEIRLLEQLMICLNTAEDRSWLEEVMEAMEGLCVQVLHLRGFGRCAGAGQAFAARCRPVGLQYLDLKNERLSDDALGAILTNSQFASICALEVGGNCLGDEFFKAFEGGAHLERLSALSLRCPIGQRAGLCGERASSFFNTDTIVGVKTLDLGLSGLDPDGIGALSRSQNLGALERLVLDGNNIDDEGAETFAEATSLARLKRLSLANNKIGSRGFRALLQSSRLQSLEALSVSGNDLTDDDIDALLETEAFPKLNTFVVHGGEFSDGCMERMIESGRFQMLGADGVSEAIQRKTPRVHAEDFLHALWQDSVEEAVGFRMTIR